MGSGRWGRTTRSSQVLHRRQVANFEKVRAWSKKSVPGESYDEDQAEDVAEFVADLHWLKREGEEATA